MKAKKLTFKPSYDGLKPSEGKSTIRMLKEILISVANAARMDANTTRMMWGICDLIEESDESETAVISNEQYEVLRKSWEDGFPKFPEFSRKWKKSVDDIIASAEDVELTEKP